MTCKGVLLSGDECDAEDRHTDPATGLCGSCAAPKSMALVHVGGTTLLADPEIDAKYRGLPPRAQAFLTAYIGTLGKIADASRVAGVSRNMHRYWLRTVPDYPAVFEVAELDVKDQWADLYADVTENGLKEHTFDGDGNLKQLRVRQDAGLLKAKMQSVDPDFAPDRDRHSGNVVIILNRTREGGWVDPAESIPEAVVLSDDDG